VAEASELPEWATHVAVDANGEVWVFEGEPVWIEAGTAPDGLFSPGHWAPADGYDGLRCDPLIDGLDDPTVPPAIARLLCVRIPRPAGWEPPAQDDDNFDLAEG
jgi:hypothetical protein